MSGKSEPPHTGANIRSCHVVSTIISIKPSDAISHFRLSWKQVMLEASIATGSSRTTNTRDIVLSWVVIVDRQNNPRSIQKSYLKYLDAGAPINTTSHNFDAKENMMQGCDSSSPPSNCNKRQLKKSADGPPEGACRDWRLCAKITPQTHALTSFN